MHTHACLFAPAGRLSLSFLLAVGLGGGGSLGRRDWRGLEILPPQQEADVTQCHQIVARHVVIEALPVGGEDELFCWVEGGLAVAGAVLEGDVASLQQEVVARFVLFSFLFGHLGSRVEELGLAPHLLDVAYQQRVLRVLGEVDVAVCVSGLLTYLAARRLQGLAGGGDTSSSMSSPSSSSCCVSSASLPDSSTASSE